MDRTQRLLARLQAAPERHAPCLLRHLQKADTSTAQARAAARPWVVLLLAHPGKDVILGDAYDVALHHIFYKTWPRLKFKQKSKRCAATDVACVVWCCMHISTAIHDALQ